MDGDGDYEEALAPYDEGNEDFFEFVDETEGVKENFMKLREMYLHPDGSITPTRTIHEDWWSRITEEEYLSINENKNVCSEGEGLLSMRSTFDPDLEQYIYEKATLPNNVTKIMSSHSVAAANSGMSFKEWVSIHYGYDEDNDNNTYIDPETKKIRYGYRANPQAKWDWYTLGGRWSNMLISKEHYLGRRPCSVCRVGDLDLDAMLQDYIKSRKDSYNLAVAELLVNEDRATKVRHKYGYTKGMSFEQYLGDAAAKFFLVHAVIMDGVWYDRCTSIWGDLGEEGINNWDKECVNLIKSLDPNKWIAIVDCHI